MLFQSLSIGARFIREHVSGTWIKTDQDHATLIADSALVVKMWDKEPIFGVNN